MALEVQGSVKFFRNEKYICYFGSDSFSLLDNKYVRIMHAKSKLKPSKKNFEKIVKCFETFMESLSE